MNRVAVWLGTVMFALSAAGLAVYLIRVGLDHADQLASVLGMVASMIGLFIAIAGLAGANRKRAEVRDSAERRPANPPRTSVRIDGTNSGNIVIGNDNKVHNNDPGGPDG